jgi:hypothetical protein
MQLVPRTTLQNPASPILLQRSFTSHPLIALGYLLTLNYPIAYPLFKLPTHEDVLKDEKKVMKVESVARSTGEIVQLHFQNWSL